MCVQRRRQQPGVYPLSYHIKEQKITCILLTTRIQRTFKNLQRTMTDTPTYSSSPHAIKDKANGNPWWCQRELVKAYNACAKSPIDCVHFGHMKSSPFLLSSCLEKDSIDKMEANVIRHTILMRPDSSRIEPKVAYVSIEYPFKSNMYEPDLQLQNEQLAILKQTPCHGQRGFLETNI